MKFLIVIGLYLVGAMFILIWNKQPEPIIEDPPEVITEQAYQSVELYKKRILELYDREKRYGLRSSEFPNNHCSYLLALNKTECRYEEHSIYHDLFYSIHRYIFGIDAKFAQKVIDYSQIISSLPKEYRCSCLTPDNYNLERYRWRWKYNFFDWNGVMILKHCLKYCHNMIDDIQTILDGMMNYYLDYHRDYLLATRTLGIEIPIVDYQEILNWIRSLEINHLINITLYGKDGLIDPSQKTKHTGYLGYHDENNKFIKFDDDIKISIKGREDNVHQKVPSAWYHDLRCHQLRLEWRDAPIDHPKRLFHSHYLDCNRI